MNSHNNISYIEIPCKSIEMAKDFFSTVFGWSFVDYGPDYCSFSKRGIDGGFYRSDANVSVDSGSPLIVLYSEDLDSTQTKIENSGGRIIKPIFEFPGRRRFHFTDPNENEFAVWTE